MSKVCKYSTDEEKATRSMFHLASMFCAEASNQPERRRTAASTCSANLTSMGEALSPLLEQISSSAPSSKDDSSGSSSDVSRTGRIAAVSAMV